MNKWLVLYTSRDEMVARSLVDDIKKVNGSLGIGFGSAPEVACVSNFVNVIRERVTPQSGIELVVSICPHHLSSFF